jgi:CHAD domain-containing protein
MSVDGLEYVLPDGVDVPAIRQALAPRLSLETDRRRVADRTFYDTFDGRLHARGLLLAHEDARVVLRDGAWSELAAAAHEQRPRRLLLADLPEGRLRDFLAPIVEVRALTPIARTRSAVQPLRALNGDEKTVVRLGLEEPSVVDDGRRVALPARLRLAVVRGYDKELATTRRLLARELGLRAAEEPLHDAAVRATGGTPGGASSRLDLALRPDQRADTAATVLLARMLDAIAQNLPGAIADVDSEFLHDLRVAVRRTRSVQRQLQGVFPPEALAHARAEFRWIQQVTGPSRDLDVYLLDLGERARTMPTAMRADLEPLRAVLLERRRRERRRMVGALRSVRLQAALDDWGALLDGLVEAPADARPDAGRPVADVAGERIRATYRRMERRGRAIDDASPAEDLHELRKTGKELRYLLELFGSLYSAAVVRPMVKTLKSLQDTLGAFQDREIQASMLRSLREEIGALDGGAQALMAMGLLVDHLEREQRSARAEFAERFAAFAADAQRNRVGKTFR